YADAADVFWHDWVLNYNLDQQLLLATKMGESGRHVGFNWFDGRSPITFPKLWAEASSVLERYGFLALGLIVVALAGRLFGQDSWRWWKNRQRVLKAQRGEAEASDATLLYQRMLSILKRRGIEKPTWLTPFEFAGVLQEPAISVMVDDLTEAYNELRFGGNA